MAAPDDNVIHFDFRGASEDSDSTSIDGANVVDGAAFDEADSGKNLANGDNEKMAEITYLDERRDLEEFLKRIGRNISYMLLTVLEASDTLPGCVSDETSKEFAKLIGQIKKSL